MVASFPFHCAPCQPEMNFHRNTNQKILVAWIDYRQMTPFIGAPSSDQRPETLFRRFCTNWYPIQSWIVMKANKSALVKLNNTPIVRSCRPSNCHRYYVIYRQHCADYRHFTSIGLHHIYIELSRWYMQHAGKLLSLSLKPPKRYLVWQHFNVAIRPWNVNQNCDWRSILVQFDSIKYSSKSFGCLTNI